MRCLLLVLSLLCAACTPRPESWPRWERFVQHLVADDGRVLDPGGGGQSTSEGQSYALFFALVANQRERFDRILAWTDRALADGELGARLPAWRWGRRSDGRWGVTDANPASDGDLWIAYSLFEAARLWQAPHYAETARRLLAQIRAQEIADAGRGGWVLLPAPQGFRLDGDRFRLDPSYLPGFQFRYFAGIDLAGPWARVWRSYLDHVPQAFAAGVAPDLYIVDRAGRITPDSERPPAGRYDAIRVYLWAAMSGGDSLTGLMPHLMGFAGHARALGAPPETVDPLSGAVVHRFSPYGFSGAVLPYLAVLGDEPTLRAQRRRLLWARLRERLTHRRSYYDEALCLFGEGWIEGRYRFDGEGRLWPRWAEQR